MDMKEFSPLSRSLSTVRGQAAIEVLVYMGFFMLIFVSMSVMFLTQINQDVVQREYQLSQSIAGQIADDVMTAQLAGPGFNATFPVPGKISGRNYMLNFSNQGWLYVTLEPTKSGGYPTVFLFPLSTRSIKLGCDGTATPLDCPGNGEKTLALHTYRWVNTSDGFLHVENVGNSTSGAILRVS